MERVREIEGLSFFIIIFFPDSPTEVTRGWILTQNGS